MTVTHHHHTFGRADLADLRTLLAWLAAHEDAGLRELAATWLEALDGSDVELPRGEWVMLSNAVYVFVAAHCSRADRQLCNRLFAFVGLITSILAKPPSRTEFEPEPVESVALEAAGSVQGTLQF